MENPYLQIVLGLIFGVLALSLYFLPSLLANKKNHKQKNGIATLNFFLGWTLIGWVGALIWAQTESK